MKRCVLFAVVVAALFVFAGCSDDNDPTEVLKYDITIINGIATDYEVWIDADIDTAGFVQDGTVANSATRVLRDRVIDVSYHIRLVEAGQDPETTFAHERTVRQTDDADVTWTVGL